ncbi:MAG: hypothetical protein V1772_05430 [Chloroflexota bacterium]
MAWMRRLGRRLQWPGLVLLVVASLVLAILAADALRDWFGARRSLATARPARTIPNTDVNPYGANFFLAREVEPWKVDKTLQMAAAAGIGWAKLHFTWESVEPLSKGEYLEPGTKVDAWAKYDRIVEACEKHGLRIIARLDRPPDWTRLDRTYKERPPDNLDDYGDYVYAFVRRYAGRIDHIQVWNEPNIFPEWGNRPVDPASYVALLKVAYQRAKEANPHVYVLSAPLAITLGQPHPEPGKWIAMSDLDYLEAMYRAGAAQWFDIYSANAFGMEFPPQDPPDPQVLNFQRVLLQRAIRERYGDEDKAVWFNEYGWNAAPESFSPEQLIWRRVSEKMQAEYTLQGIALARERWPWAGVFNIWYFRQVGSIPADRADYYFRMMDVDFTPRPLYFAVQEVASHRVGVGPGRYEETNPALQRYGQWRNVIARAASGGATMRSEREGDSLIFTFQGPAVDLIAPRGPEAGHLRISLDGHSVAGLPADAQGFSYVDLYAPEPVAQARLPLVRGVGSGEHTLRLTVAGTRSPASSGHACSVDAIEVLVEGAPGPVPWKALALAAGTIATGWAAAWGWRRARRGLRAR